MVGFFYFFVAADAEQQRVVHYVLVAEQGYIGDYLF